VCSSDLLAPAFWVFLSLLVAATFIDIDHLIIPDEITIGGTATGLLCSALLPGMMGVSVWWQGLALSVAGALAGYFLLWDQSGGPDGTGNHRE